MNEEEGAGGSPEEVPQGSVFGNLPGSRPGVRSPRRTGDGSGRPAAPAGTESEPAAAPAGAAARAEPPPRARASTAPGVASDAEGSGESERGIEDVAWAGVAAAAEAATVGVRIANRAFEALRDAVERR